jgi:class 3 adenylate cyclase
MDSYMKKKWGIAYGFRKNYLGLETYYNKQLRVKYKSKMRKTIFFLVMMVALQEILLYIKDQYQAEVYAVRVLTFGWIVMTFIFLFLSNKVFPISALFLISIKTTICIFEMYLIKLTHPDQTERQTLSFLNFLLHSMLDSLVFISMGIFPVTLLSILNAVSYVCIIVNTLILRLGDRETPALIAGVTFFYAINFVDLLNHFDTELNLFFNYVGIEQKGYYLNTFVDRLLPKHIRGLTASTECYSEVTLLFADIVGFTEYSAGKNPRQVVEMLSQLFTAFDKECNTLNLYKLYTIGDCYVVMSFLDKNNRKKPAEEANDVVQLAIFMIRSIAEVRAKINFDKLNMRIGIHTGTVYGGVIGTDIVRFDLYGPDVLTANKMESGGTPGRINVSENTRRYLDELEKSNYAFEFNKEIEIKVVGRKYKSYFLVTGNENKEEHA